MKTAALEPALHRWLLVWNFGLLRTYCCCVREWGRGLLPPPERGLSSPQQRRTAGGLQALAGTGGRPRVAADWKVRAPVAVPRCAQSETNPSLRFWILDFRF